MRGELNSTGDVHGARAAGSVLLCVCLSLLVWGMLAAGSALAAPLSPSSPLYNPGGSPIVNGNPDVVAEYKGTIVENFENPPIQGSLASSYRKAELKWDETVAGPVDQIEYTGVYGKSAIHWHVNSLSGQVTQKGTEDDGKPFGCEGKFTPTSTDGGEGGISVPAETPGHPAGGGDPATNSDYSVRPPFGLPASLVSSSGPAGPVPTCATSAWNTTLGDSAWGDAVAFASEEPAVGTEWGDTVYPTVYFPPGGGHTQSLPFKYICAPPKCGPESGTSGKAGLVSATIESSITFSSPGLSSGSPTTKKTTPGKRAEGKPPNPVTCPRGSKPTCQDKKLAQEDLKGLLGNLANQCAIAGLGSGLIVAGLAAPESGVAVVLAAAGPTGAEIFALAGPTCALLIKRAYDDAKIIEDPPIGHLDRLARPAKTRGAGAGLPSCTPHAAAIHSFCESLRTEAAHYLSALRRTVAIDAALLITVDRVTGAARAHRGSALRAQVSHATSLRSRFRAAASAERAAARAIAKLISAEGLELNLTAAQTDAGIAKVLAALARRHVSRRGLEHLTGAPVPAGPTSVLGVLAG